MYGIIAILQCEIVRLLYFLPYSTLFKLPKYGVTLYWPGDFDDSFIQKFTFNHHQANQIVHFLRLDGVFVNNDTSLSKSPHFIFSQSG